MSIDIKETLGLLDYYLVDKGIQRSFIICGGASLILQGITRQNRITKDVDVVAPQIDQALKDAAIKVSEKLGISQAWLNSDPEGLTQDLEPGWEGRILEVYTGNNLHVFSISRTDMIFSKFYAYCDRQKDIQDLIDLKVTVLEINHAANITATKDGNPKWIEYVEEQKLKLKMRMGYE